LSTASARSIAAASIAAALSDIRKWVRRGWLGLRCAGFTGSGYCWVRDRPGASS
jgi:hypothetical protein